MTRQISVSHLDTALRDDRVRAANERWRREDGARRAATAPAPPAPPAPADSPRRNRPKPKPAAKPKPKPPAKASEPVPGQPPQTPAKPTAVPEGHLLLTPVEVATLRDVLDTHPIYAPRRHRS